MSFTAAALIVVAAVAVLLGLTCYHLLSRLDRLEEAVLGGLQPPSTRLSREQFERRFRAAVGRAAMARRIGHGVVLVFGPEATDHDITAALGQLGRGDQLVLFGLDGDSVAAVATVAPAGATVELCPDDAVPATTPFLYVLDEGRVARAQPLATTDDLLDALRDVT